MGEAKRRKKMDASWGKRSKSGIGIQIQSLPDHAVDERTLALRDRVIDKEPTFNVACVRISEGNHAAIGVIWFYLDRVKPDSLQAGIVGSDEASDQDNFKLESGVFFSQSGIPAKSKQWVDEGVKLRTDIRCRFKPAVQSWAKKQLTSSERLIKLVASDSTPESAAFDGVSIAVKSDWGGSSSGGK